MTFKSKAIVFAALFVFFSHFCEGNAASRPIAVPQRKENICMSANPGCCPVFGAEIRRICSFVSDLKFGGANYADEVEGLRESQSGTRAEWANSSSKVSDSAGRCESPVYDADITATLISPIFTEGFGFDQKEEIPAFPTKDIRSTLSIPDSTASTPALVPEPVVAVSEKKEHPNSNATKKIVAIQQTKISPAPPLLRLRCTPTWTDDKVREETVWIYRYRWRQNPHKPKHTACKKVSSKPMTTKSNRVQVLSSRSLSSEKESQLFEIYFWPYSTFLFRIDNPEQEYEWTTKRPKWFSEAICEKLFEYTLPQGRRREEWPTYLSPEDLKEAISLNFGVSNVEVKAFRVPAYKVFAVIGTDLFALRRDQCEVSLKL